MIDQKSTTIIEEMRENTVEIRSLDFSSAVLVFRRKGISDRIPYLDISKNTVMIPHGIDSPAYRTF
jgi:hypothetical protein